MSEKIIEGLIVGVVVIVLSLLVRIYVDPIMPEKKKAISSMKKFFLFNVKYTLNMFFLIYFFITFEFNKYFILMICFYFGIFIFNITIDVLNKTEFKPNEKIRKIHLEQILLIAEEIDKINGIKNN